MRIKRETKMLIIAEAMLLALLALMIMSSCATKKKVTENTIVHDTLIVQHTDTIVNERVIRHTDTLKLVTERVITLKDEGEGRVDTIRIVENNDHYRYIYVGDSTRNLRSVTDSIIKILDSRHNKATTKTSAYPWKWLIVGLLLLAACIIVLHDRKR